MFHYVSFNIARHRAPQRNGGEGVIATETYGRGERQKRREGEREASELHVDALTISLTYCSCILGVSN